MNECNCLAENFQSKHYPSLGKDSYVFEHCQNNNCCIICNKSDWRSLIDIKFSSASDFSSIFLPQDQIVVPVLKGCLWVQKERLFPKWKERFCVLTSEYFQCFKKSHSSISEMGDFVTKVSETFCWGNTNLESISLGSVQVLHQRIFQDSDPPTPPPVSAKSASI